VNCCRRAGGQSGSLEMSNWEVESAGLDSRDIYLQDTKAGDGAGFVREDTMLIELEELSSRQIP